MRKNIVFTILIMLGAATCVMGQKKVNSKLPDLVCTIEKVYKITSDSFRVAYKVTNIGDIIISRATRPISLQGYIGYLEDGGRSTRFEATNYVVIDGNIISHNNPITGIIGLKAKLISGTQTDFPFTPKPIAVVSSISLHLDNRNVVGESNEANNKVSIDVK